MEKIIIFLIFLVVGYCIFWIITHHGNKEVLRMFRSGNVIVAGHKGRGKDLLFQYVISARERAGERHAANITFTSKTTVHPPKWYELHQNTYTNFMTGKYDQTENKQYVEKEDYYISDIGTCMPAQLGRKLEKEYPTLPIVYALSRQLFDANIHCNAQNFGRVWDKLREQGDYYIYCEKAKVLFKKIAVQRFIIYDRYQSALANIQPYKCTRRLFGILPPRAEDYSRANEHNAKYGTIRRYSMWHILPKKHYDTREFHNKVYGKPAPELDKRKKRNIKKREEKEKKN